MLVFLPVTLAVYFGLLRFRLRRVALCWLVVASLYFHAVWNIQHLPLLLGSVAFNFFAGELISKTAPTRRGWVTGAAIAINLAVLALFKYAGFLTDLANDLGSLSLAVPEIALPLGISFFTFTQIAYLVDNHRGIVRDRDPLNYALFVTFFPHLIAGPIIHHAEMMPQFGSRWNAVLRYRNILFGLCLFGMGLFKKVVLADTLAIHANAGFGGSGTMDFYSAWGTCLAYTFQLYFDFSGYSDMALGAARLFNIRLPVNFNSPYKALSIQDFWRRWHMTLSRYLRDYLYIPLGGNRSGPLRTHFNLLLTFTLGGLWHGATWMFVIWGVLHGLAMVVNRLWQQLNRPLPAPLAWVLTFLFVAVSWVFFRAETWSEARRILAGMVNLGSALSFDPSLSPLRHFIWSGWLGDGLLDVMPAGLVANLPVLVFVALSFWIVSRRNSMELVADAVARKRPWLMLALFTIALVATLSSNSSVFLYFNF